MISATSCMDLVVSADSAPIHLSSALNIPLLLYLKIDQRSIFVGTR
ncbi:hypothetical protein [Proteus mirabilis]|nr:hypothetical protein [Proteus mirabilis]